MNLYDSLTEDIWSSRKEFVRDTTDDIGEQPKQVIRKPVPMDAQEVELATRLMKQPSLLTRFIGSQRLNSVKLALTHAANSTYRMLKTLPEMPKAQTVYGEVGEKEGKEEKHVEIIVGGKGDNPSGDFKEWLESEEGQKQLSRGIQVEMEHTNSRAIAREIAIDHLKEDKKYYCKLKKAGLADELDEAVSMGIGSMQVRGGPEGDMPGAGTGIPVKGTQPARKLKLRKLGKDVLRFGSPANANMVGTNPMSPGRSAYAKGI